MQLHIRPIVRHSGPLQIGRFERVEPVPLRISDRILIEFMLFFGVQKQCDFAETQKTTNFEPSNFQILEGL